MADTKTEAPQKPKVEEPSSGTGVESGRTRRGRLKPRTKIALGVLGLLVIVAGVLLYRYFTSYESTDDAQIDGYIYPVSSRIAGYVTRVTVDNNQYVEAGTVLAQLDPKDYEVALASAKSALANDQASAAALLTNVPLTSVNTTSQLSSAQADVENANAGL